MKKAVVLALCCLLIGGCGKKEEPVAETPIQPRDAVVEEEPTEEAAAEEESEEVETFDTEPVSVSQDDGTVSIDFDDSELNDALGEAIDSIAVNVESSEYTQFAIGDNAFDFADLTRDKLNVYDNVIETGVLFGMQVVVADFANCGVTVDNAGTMGFPCMVVTYVGDTPIMLEVTAQDDQGNPDTSLPEITFANGVKIGDDLSTVQTAVPELFDNSTDEQDELTGTHMYTCSVNDSLDALLGFQNDKLVVIGYILNSEDEAE